MMDLNCRENFKVDIRIKNNKILIVRQRKAQKSIAWGGNGSLF